MSAQTNMKIFSSQPRIINLLLSIGMVILPLCGILFYFQIHQLINANALVVHTEKVINASNSVLLRLTDAESRVNYYLLSNDKPSIQSLSKIISDAQRDIELLKYLTKDNPIQVKRVNELRNLANEKIQLIDQMISSLNSKDNHNVLLIATSQKRKVLKENTSKLIADMNQQELNLLEKRNDIVLNEVKKSYIIFFIFVSLSECFIILSFILLNYNLRQRDIAVRKQIEIEKKLISTNKKLQESDERYLLATEGSSVGLWDWEVNTDKVFYSPYLKKMLGYTDKEFPNTIASFEKILHPLDYDRFWNLVTQHLNNHAPFKIEYRLKNKTGKFNWFEATAQALWNEEGKAIRISGSIIDVTDRKKAEQRLRVQYAIIKLIAGAANLEQVSIEIIKEICQGLSWEIGAIWKINKKKNALICSDVWHEPSPLLEKFAKETWSTKLAYGEGLPGNIWKEGKPIWFSNLESITYPRAIIARQTGLKSAFGFPIAAEKTILGIIEFFTLEHEDIDQRILNLMAIIGMQIGQFILRRESESALRESETYQKSILESATDSIITINDHREIVSFNTQTIKEFNYPSNKLKHLAIELLIPNFNKHAENFLNEANAELLGVRTNGETFPVEIKISEMLVNNEVLTVINVRNIAERKKLEKIKNEFVSVVSHELRTPLTSIRGALGLILGGTTGSYSDKMKKLLDLANKNCNRLLSLINDILDFEKIEAGKMTFKFEIINILELVKEAINANKIFAEKYNVKLFLTESESTDVKVNVDGNRLMQVLTNLISNAVKFSTPEETITLSIKKEQNNVRVSVTNKGIGIPIEFQPYIFQKFSQADTSDTRGKGGTGLGLSISKSIIERLGGTLHFVSKLNDETTFYFDLPVCQNKLEEEKSIMRPSSPNIEKILICEDDMDQAVYLSKLLESAGFNIDIANTVQEAKELLAKNIYQVLLLDLILPDQDGISFIRELRTAEKTRALPIIILSAIAETGRSLLNGESFSIKDWLDKPIDFEKLMSAINHVKKKTYPKKPTILHVEDDPSCTEIIHTLLMEHANIISAATIKETKEKLRQFKFDLLILDLLLPDGNAEALFPLISEYAIPVIIYSITELGKTLPKIVKHVVLKSEATNEKLLTLVKHVLETN